MIQNLIFGIIFFDSSGRSSGHYQSFFFNFRFSSRKSQSQQKLAKKITHLTIQFCSKNLTHFTNLNSFDIENNMLSQHSQKPLWLYKFYAKHFSVWCQKSICTAPFLDAQERHSWSTLKRNLFLSRRSKVLSGKGYDGEEEAGEGSCLNNFVKVARCFSLAKCFTIFHFNWHFWKFNYSLAFWCFYL